MVCVCYPYRISQEGLVTGQGLNSHVVATVLDGTGLSNCSELKREFSPDPHLWNELNRWVILDNF